jgi:hypothetical protein
MRTFLTLLLGSIATLAVSAQSVGPDVIVGSISDVGNYGTDGSGIYAYSLGTTSCNIGTVPVQWVANTNAHPVIGQHVFRLKPVAGQPYSRFEMIGMSWLKHGFTALAGNLCNSCQNPGTGSLLGVGCSDPYGASLNGSQGNGCRSDVNASTGYFPYPSTGFPGAAPTIGRRIQIQATDVNPALNAGATYWADCQYVTADDALAGNKNNNASYRLMAFGTAPNFTGALSGGTVQQQPAIMAWAAVDASVQITNVDILNDGRFIIAKRVTSLGGGNYHYEFAIHNLNSDRSGRGFTVDFPAGTTITQAGFRDVGYHSFEIWDGTNWPATINGASINWATTQTFAQNPNANALRWGTSYNFWFDATAAAETNESIELFKPEPCPADPIITQPGNYLLNSAATFDNPTLTAPLPGPSGDDISSNFPIGFPFTFYGTSYTTVNICTNGFLQFNGASTTFVNACIPNSNQPNGIVAGYWRDLFPTVGQITYQTLGSAPNRRFVASWNGVQNYPAGSGIFQSFKIILDETSNLITSTIISSGDGGVAATRGVENGTGTFGTQASCNVAGSAVAGTSQTYTWNTVIVPSATLTVTGNTGPNGSLTWFVNSNAHSAPVVLVASLDPGPMNLGPLGVINLGLTPGLYAVVADGAGVLQLPNAGDWTDSYCGDLSVTIPFGPAGLPPGLTIYNQGVVIGTSNPPPPNGQFHITTLVTINT